MRERERKWEWVTKWLRRELRGPRASVRSAEACNLRSRRGGEGFNSTRLARLEGRRWCDCVRIANQSETRRDETAPRRENAEVMRGEEKREAILPGNLRRPPSGSESERQSAHRWVEQQRKREDAGDDSGSCKWAACHRPARVHTSQTDFGYSCRVLFYNKPWELCDINWEKC